MIWKSPKSMKSSNESKGLQILRVVKLQEEACELPGKTIIQWNSKTYPGMWDWDVMDILKQRLPVYLITWAGW